MTTSEGARGRGPTYSVDEFVAKLQDFIARKSSNSRDDCVLASGPNGLEVCCPIDVEDGIEIVCTPILEVLEAE